MIVTERYSESLTRAYSDAGLRITRDGMVFDEAVDPVGSGRVYEETDEPVGGAEATVQDYEAALAKLGVIVDDESGADEED